MPLYEFICTECKNKFEDLISVDDPNSKCPKCNGDSEKLISRVFGIVKGSENRTVDHVIGADAEARWKKIEERKAKRKKQKQMEN